MHGSASQLIDNLLIAQHSQFQTGIYSVCSANPYVMLASIRRAKRDKSLCLIESTCNQVNQHGGYTGETPKSHAQRIRKMAEEEGLPLERLILGGDHLGPNPWKHLPASEAMAEAIKLVEASISAGYFKIHLDTSMPLGGDQNGGLVSARLIAERTAQLASAAEARSAELGLESKPMYVVGTEVPVPGGASESKGLSVTAPEDAQETIENMRQAFESIGLLSAWERVFAIVVQPGVEFSQNLVHDYEPIQAQQLSELIEEYPQLVYEAHSTDYQTQSALSSLVRDHFAILKVGPELTFALREALFSLSLIEKLWLATQNMLQPSGLFEIIDQTMIENSEHWREYYKGNAASEHFARIFSYSDRIRYYWAEVPIEGAIEVLLSNLRASPPPLSLIHQFFPNQYWKIREGELQVDAEEMIIDYIGESLSRYARACGRRL